jgi:hypothetical protein
MQRAGRRRAAAAAQPPPPPRQPRRRTHTRARTPRLIVRAMPTPISSTLKIFTQKSSWMRCTATTWLCGRTMPRRLAMLMASPSTASPCG